MILLWGTLLLNIKAAVYFMYKNQCILCEENMKSNIYKTTKLIDLVENIHFYVSISEINNTNILLWTPVWGLQ